ncbi:MAG: hypothetical protein JO297_14155 [Nitrososphaeraceae archaeon]|nr:hypothetical protein [Nitrososphaeraceae archaeon]
MASNKIPSLQKIVARLEAERSMLQMQVDIKNQTISKYKHLEAMGFGLHELTFLSNTISLCRIPIITFFLLPLLFLNCATTEADPATDLKLSAVVKTNVIQGYLVVYIRPHGSFGTHEACVWKLAGRDEDEIRSVFEIGAADAKHPSPFANWDYTHHAYHRCPTHVYSDYGRVTPEKWYGMKAVRIVAQAESSVTFTYMKTL